jgi:hypothetical protein
MFTPNRTGEFAGRILYLNKNENKAKSIALSFIGSISQLVITLCIGSFMLAYYLVFVDEIIAEPLFTMLIFSITIGFNFFVLLCFFHIPLLLVIIKKIGLLKVILPYLNPLRKQSYRTLFKVLIYSISRYFVFLIQFYIALQLFGVDISLAMSVVVIPIIYFALAVIPSISLSELGMRESMSLLLIGQFSTNYLGIVAASGFIWIINLALPALVGAIFILVHRFSFT